MRALAIVCLLATAVAADDKTDAEVLFRAGERAFTATQYAVAADAFEQAYAKLPLPAIAFSLAQAHRLQYFVDNQPQHLERAVHLYHAYVDAQKTGGRVSDAVANLAQIEPLLHELQAAGAMKNAPAPAAKKTRLMVTSDVEGARATIDGDGGTTPLVREVTPGEHAVVIEADGYASYTVKATAVPDEMVPVEGKLVAKPARLAVHAHGGSHVSIDGRAVAGALDGTGVDVPAGKHYVTVTATGHAPYGRELELARGGTITLDAHMPITTQRRVSRYLLIGGGALAIGTGIAGFAALSADSDASKLHDALAMGGQDPTAISRYAKLRDDRDARVTTTEVLGGITAVVLTTGVLVYLFDNPSAEAPPLAPAVGQGSAGLVYSGRF